MTTQYIHRLTAEENELLKQLIDIATVELRIKDMDSAMEERCTSLREKLDRPEIKMK